MEKRFHSLPEASSETGLRVLRELARNRSLLAALEIMHAEVGDSFQISLPRFSPAVLVGSEWNRTLLVTEREKFSWRVESDPVTSLLRHGILVEDGDSHDWLRSIMEPGLRRPEVIKQIAAMVHYTDEITRRWGKDSTVDMLVEMRRISLLILFGTLFKVDVVDDLDHIWKPILKAIKFISPGWWIVWPGIPRFGYKGALVELDNYLLTIIRERRNKPYSEGDWLSELINGGLDDDLIRDQMLTMLIAGHDTSTALLAWTLYLFGSHPDSLAKARAEVDSVVGQSEIQTAHLRSLHFLDQVIKESLRLFPPIHVGNRLTRERIQSHGCSIPKDKRVMYSIYLTQRDSSVWEDTTAFRPGRFDRYKKMIHPPFSYIPFGAGPRNCIGAAFAQIEVKVILARVIQQYDLSLKQMSVGLSMGATLEPRPGVLMGVRRRV